MTNITASELSSKRQEAINIFDENVADFDLLRVYEAAGLDVNDMRNKFVESMINEFVKNKESEAKKAEALAATKAEALEAKIQWDRIVEQKALKGFEVCGRCGGAGGWVGWP